jgi:hypothetical protein
VGHNSREIERKVAHEILHCRLTCLVDTFQIFQHKMPIAVDNGYPNFIVVLALPATECTKSAGWKSLTFTEYEFFLRLEEPVASMFGEHNLEYNVFAWQVSIMKNIS